MNPRHPFNPFRILAAIRRTVQFVWWHKFKRRLGMGKAYARYADDTENGRNPK
jgi:hypothetical protein